MKTLEQLVPGDTVVVEGGMGGHPDQTARITEVGTKYDPDTGEPYKVIYLGKRAFNAHTGYAITAPTAYSIRPLTNSEFYSEAHGFAPNVPVCVVFNRPVGVLYKKGTEYLLWFDRYTPDLLILHDNNGIEVQPYPSEIHYIKVLH